jgi:hypothetical protein
MMDNDDGMAQDILEVLRSWTVQVEKCKDGFLENEMKLAVGVAATFKMVTGLGRCKGQVWCFSVLTGFASEVSFCWLGYFEEWPRIGGECSG